MNLNQIDIVDTFVDEYGLQERFSTRGGSLVVIKLKEGMYLRVFIDLERYDVNQRALEIVGKDNYVTDFYVHKENFPGALARYSAFMPVASKSTFRYKIYYYEILHIFLADIPSALQLTIKDFPTYEEYESICKFAFASNLLME